MAERDTISVVQLDGPHSLHSESDLRLVYADVFAEPPYSETAAEIASAFRGFSQQVQAPGFRAALSRTSDGRPVGMAYGAMLRASTRWWDQLATPVPDELRREDGHRTFGLLELAVRTPWRGQGVARRLHDTLLTDLQAERVMLNVREDATAAHHTYRAWGYQKVGEFRSTTDGATYHVMLRELR